MTAPTITDVSPATLPVLADALARLSADLGDAHGIETDTLHAALFGTNPACRAVIAQDSDATLLGAALFSPVLSTTAGGAGAYISDLWVAEPARGQALGRNLLAAVAQRAHTLWRARFIRLVSYRANPRATAFYSRLGFAEKAGETVLQLGGDAFDPLRG